MPDKIAQSLSTDSQARRPDGVGNSDLLENFLVAVISDSFGTKPFFRRFHFKADPFWVTFPTDYCGRQAQHPRNELATVQIFLVELHHLLVKDEKAEKIKRAELRHQVSPYSSLNLQ